MRLVSIDVGNTLVTSDKPGVATLVTRAASSSPALDEAIASLHTQPVTQALLDRICERLGIKPFDIKSYCPPDPIPLPGVVDALVRLKASKVRIVTLSNVVSLDATPLPDGLTTQIDAHYQSFRVGAAKPDPNAFAAMLNAENVRARDAIHIGDSWRCDVIGALSVGMVPIWVTSKQKHSIGNYEEEVTVAASFCEAVELLMRGPLNERE
ncbi:HAD family hydrolase [Bradyrhizobium yuanmingense]|uniref:HAD family hydrolase n=1 Tax=Bradyrhizobium yuanmingense TaxID=108015 RepID=UPI0023B9EA72|nr:HAD family hydrolase [Bradyrhizobium yuanmingense]MDF0492757.1 HAD family hydrolase [Bradyrhizobium yuanmingense]